MLVRAAEEADVEAMAEIMVRAFEHDPWTLGHAGPATAIPAVFDYERQALRRYWLASQVADVAVSAPSAEPGSAEPAELLGVALWQPPHAAEMPQELEELFIGALGLDPQREEADHALAVDARPAQPHWHLELLAVSPSAQGMGVGSALLRHGLERTGDLTASLDSTTPESRRLYERLGFRMIREFTDSRGVTQYAMRHVPE